MDNCPEGYCGENAQCVEDNICQCKDGFSGEPYFWGGCYPDPCSTDPCGDYALCEAGQGTNYQCVCPEGGYYIRDPNDDQGCVINPCGNIPDATSNCEPNFGKV